nr:MAG TPA: Protein of unknown function (DUF2701) [Caudoviricetes sp.]
MKILFIIALCIFVALSFYKYKCTSISKYINFVDKELMNIETMKRDLEDLSPKACTFTYCFGYITSLLVKLSIVYLSCLGISTL